MGKWTKRRLPNLDDPLAQVQLAEMLSKAGHPEVWNILRDGLPSMKKPLQQVMLAGLLAEQGFPDGWNVVRDALGQEWVSVALGNIEYFDKLRGKDGIPIDVIAELTKLSKTAPASNRKEIDAKIAELKLKKK